MVTHEPEDKKYVDRIIWLKDGILENQNRTPSRTLDAEVFKQNNDLSQLSKNQNLLNY
jgi:ABC-type lipoprotein export system ATPase subunit